MNKVQQQVQEFHAQFKVLINSKPTIPEDKVKTLRKHLIQEEVTELFKGIDANDLTEIADGLADVLYVVYGTAVSYGINLDPISDEVHRSNMSKIWEDGTVHYNEHGKVIKPDTYSPANIKYELLKQR